MMDVTAAGETVSEQPAKNLSARIFQFGAFELRTETGELSKHGIRVRLQIKPLQVLEALLAKPGELVTREELCGRLWPAGTFVDFESGLNTATNRLRAALNDSAESPRYIETLPRLGYRFICPVVEIVPEEEVRGVPVATSQIAEQTAAVEQSGEAAVPAENRIRPILGKWPIKPYWAILAAGLIIAAALLFSYLQLRANARHSMPVFHQLTFRPGSVRSARFLPDLKSAIYTVAGEAGGARTEVSSLDGSTFHGLDFASGTLASVSPHGDLSFLTGAMTGPEGGYHLVRFKENGGSSQTISDGTRGADWLANGAEMALVRKHGTETLVEFPAGHVVYSSRGSIDCLRVSPHGDSVAFLEHPVRDDDGGYLRIVDDKGNTRVLTNSWSSVEGLAWSPTGNEVWFTASSAGATRALYATTETGRLRQVSSTPSSLRLFDISRAGRALVTVEDIRMTMSAKLAGDTAESDVSNLDYSHVDDISADGRLILFTEAGDAGGAHYSAYTLNQQTHHAVRFAAGRGLALSPDGKSALTIDPRDRGSLTLTSLATHVSRKISGSGFEYQWAKFLPDGRTLLVGGGHPLEPLTICEQPIDGGKPVPLNGPTYMDDVAVSPDGSKIAGNTGNQVIIFDRRSNTSRALAKTDSAIPVAWSKDGNDLFVLTFGNSTNNATNRIVKIDLRSGEVETWTTIAPSNAPGFEGLGGAVAAPDADAYAYSSHLDLSRLYVVDGWS
jgi:DNA-binding winged helix-turn-helix (wHTH) protein/Tol biopolymer transport system component